MKNGREQKNLLCHKNTQIKRYLRLIYSKNKRHLLLIENSIAKLNLSGKIRYYSYISFVNFATAMIFHPKNLNECRKQQHSKHFHVSLAQKQCFLWIMQIWTLLSPSRQIYTFFSLNRLVKPWLCKQCNYVGKYFLNCVEMNVSVWSFFGLNSIIKARFQTVLLLQRIRLQLQGR